MEYRKRPMPGTTATIETRDNGKEVISGYAAVFHREGDAGTEFRMRHDIVERIAPTAFDRAMKENHDARALLNHDSNYLLGKRSAGTLRLSVDNVGLRYEIDYNPDDPQHVSVRAKIQRGDMTGSSFAFSINGAKGQRFDKLKDYDVRNILDVDLYDVGPVTFPAYEGTTTGMRSGECDDAIEARDVWRKEAEAEAVSVRCRRIALDNE